MSDLPQTGDRIELVEMGADDPCPMDPGSKGTVQAVVDNVFGGGAQIQVEWDPDVGRSLCLVVPPDCYRIIERVMD